MPVLDPPGGFALEPNPGPEQTWPEMFEFDIQPGDLTGEELMDRIVEFDPAGGEPVPGSARHVGWVRTPGGRVDFFEAKFTGSAAMPGIAWCTMRTGPHGSSSSCGDGPDAGVEIGLREMGGSVSQVWQSWDIGVTDDTASVTGVTEDGAEYTIIPNGRFAFVMWRSERGRMQLTSFDADGNELQSVTIGELP